MLSLFEAAVKKTYSRGLKASLLESGERAPRLKMVLKKPAWKHSLGG